MCKAKVEPYVSIRQSILTSALQYLERYSLNDIEHQCGRYTFNLCKIKLMLGDFNDGKRVKLLVVGRLSFNQWF